MAVTTPSCHWSSGPWQWLIGLVLVEHTHLIFHFHLMFFSLSEGSETKHGAEKIDDLAQKFSDRVS